MSEKSKRIVLAAVMVFIFVASVALTIIGQRNIGPGGLGLMMLGLAGLVFLLWFYNRQYK